MLENIPHIVAKVTAVKYNKLYQTYGISAHVDNGIKEEIKADKLRYLFYISGGEHIPVNSTVLYTRQVSTRYCFIQFNLEKKYVAKPIRQDDKIVLYTTQSKMLNLVKFCYNNRHLLDMSTVIDNIFNYHPEEAVDVIQYALRYDLKFITDVLSNDMKQIANVELNTNHRM